MAQNDLTDGSVGGRVRHLRKAAGMTQNELADRAGIARQTLLNQEHDSQKCSRRIDDIAEALNVSASYLRYGIADLQPGQSYIPAPSERPSLTWVPVYSPRSGFEAMRTSCASVTPDSMIATPRQGRLVGMTVSSSGIHGIDDACLNGDVLVLFAPINDDHSTSISPGSMVVVADVTSETLLVRRARHQTPRGDLEYVPDDPMYPSLSPTGGARLVGVVIELHRPAKGFLATSHGTIAPYRMPRSLPAQ